MTATKGKQLEVTGKNKPGTGAAVFCALAGAKVNVTASCCFEMGNTGNFWLVVDKLPKAQAALKKAGFKSKTADVVMLELPNKPGAMATALEDIAELGVNVLYAYGSAAAGKTARLVMLTNKDAVVLRKLK